MIREQDRKALLAWYDANGRDLPWRRTREPYPVWVSEVMLQQTQIATALPYYERWMRRFPTVEALAAADEQDVLALWQGLGYYRRCRYLLNGARYIVALGLPTSAQGWLTVPGVGRYTAGAIASICFGECAAVVDGNVERVFARTTACGETGPTLYRHAWEWAERNLDPHRPGDWNQALMELGATVCTPSKPRCEGCPLEPSCAARQSWRVEQFPVARTTPSVRLRTHVCWVPFESGAFGVCQVPAGEWWEGMWEFPREDATDDRAAAEAQLRERVGAGWTESLGEFRHTVTRHRVVLEASLVRCDARAQALRWVTRSELEALAMPAPQRKTLRRALALLGLD
ncbi:MAG: A/G-specific adenine glycosylase [Fimbriimonadaceae bacterium]|nr:A/G-specific adenine glycosylase [Fimbriimonadaceae bacterium]